MSELGQDLLRRLASGVIPVETGRQAQSGAASGSQPGFAALLASAQGGSLESGLPVRAAGGTEFGLNESQLARMGAVIDQLHASGASHALVALDGRFFKVDILTREIREEFDPASGARMDGIDAVASVPSIEPDGSATVGVPPIGLMSPSLLDALSEKSAA